MDIVSAMLLSSCKHPLEVCGASSQFPTVAGVLNQGPKEPAIRADLCVQDTIVVAKRKIIH
jgi:hypothetical protein